LNRASQILRDYLERRRSDPGIADLDDLREENLRRLLRHAGAARQPREQLESRLLEAMLRESRRTAERHRGWQLFSRPAWMILAPAVALAGIAVTVTWHARSAGHSDLVASLPPPSQSSKPPIHRQTSPYQERPVIGLVLMGDLQRQHPGEERWEPVDSGTRIELGDAVSTGPGEIGSIVFLDTSISRLSSNTTVRYLRSGRAGAQRPDLVSLARGEVWHVVEKGGPSFTVQTPTAKAIVHGTEFGVAVDPKEKTTLTVKVGKVALQAANRTVMVAAGMQSVVLPGRPPMSPIFAMSRPQRPPAGRRWPGKPPVTPAAKSPAEGLADDQGGKPLPVPQTPHASPPPPLGTAGSDSGDGEDRPQRPISTSR
jgi:hypothetical protein